MKKLSIFSVLFVIGMTLVPQQAAQATEVGPNSGLIEAVESAKPGFAEATVENLAVESAQVIGVGLSVTAADVNEATLEASGIEITMPDVQSVTAEKPGLQTFSDRSGNLGLIQEVAHGFRVIRSIQDATSPTNFDYNFSRFLLLNVS